MSFSLSIIFAITLNTMNIFDDLNPFTELYYYIWFRSIEYIQYTISHWLDTVNHIESNCPWTWLITIDHSTKL